MRKHAGKPHNFARQAHHFLIQAPPVCFLGALLTDIIYSRTGDMTWSNFSGCLLAVGLIFAVPVVIIALVTGIRRRREIASRVWAPWLAYLGALILAFVNSLVHTRDAWTSVVPTGLTLSILTFIIILITAWLASQASSRATEVTA